MKFLAVGPPPLNRALVIRCEAGAIAFQAREYAAVEFTRLDGGNPVSPQSLFVHETGESAPEDVRLRFVGTAASDPSTLRLQVATRKKDGEFTEWADR